MEQTKKPDEYIENVRLVNNRSVPLTVVFEPWFSSYDVPPGEHVVVSSGGSVGDGIEISIADDNCTVWGWPGNFPHSIGVHIAEQLWSLSKSCIFSTRNGISTVALR